LGILSRVEGGAAHSEAQVREGKSDDGKGATDRQIDRWMDRRLALGLQMPTQVKST